MEDEENKQEEQGEDETNQTEPPKLDEDKGGVA